MDWEKFDREGEELTRRFREVSERIGRQREEARLEREAREAGIGPVLARERPPQDEGSAIAARFDRFERMLSDILQHLSVIRQDLSLVQRDVAELKDSVARLTQRVESLERDVAQIREQMATEAELESVRGDIQMVADGFAQTQARLVDVADLMRRHISA